MSLLKKNLPILSLLTLVFLCVPTLALASGGIDEILWAIVNGVFGTLMGFAGLLLNFSIEYFVVGFGNQFVNGGVGIVVDALWTNVRDIFNITFIFGLVYIGFKMILNSDDSGTRRWLVSLILAALLVNFSLFITKFIVDFTNILATQIVNGGFGGPKISDFFMDSLGVTSFWKGLPTGASYTYIFGAAMIFIVGTFVFAAGGIMLVIRYAALALYMVMSPLMFLGWVFPGLQSVTSKYWSGFLGRAFFAPVYLLLLFFAASIVKQFYGSNQGTVDFVKLFAGKTTAGGNPIEPNFATTLAPFILTCIFLIAAVVVANKLSADGASTAMKIGNNLKSRAQRGLQQGALGATRGTARLAAAPVAIGARRAAYGLGNTLDRNINRMQNSNSRVVRGLSRTVVADAAARGASNRLKNSKFGLSRTREQDQAASNRIHSQADNRATEEQARLQVQANPVTNTSTDAQITARQDARQVHAQEVSQMSNEQVVERARQDRNYAMSPEFASLLSEAQTTALRESGIYNNAEMTQLEQNRTDGALQEVNQVLTNSNASVVNLDAAIDNLNRTVSKMSDQQISDLVARDVRAGRPTDPAFAASMSQTQFDTYMSSSASQTDKTALRGARTAGQQRIAQNGSVVDPATAGAAATDAGFQDRHRRRLFRNAQQAGALPATALADPAAASYLTPRIIEEFLNNNPSNPDIALVRNNVNSYIAGARPEIRNAWHVWRTTTPQGARFT